MLFADTTGNGRNLGKNNHVSMNSIVTISGSSRPSSYTAKALAVVNEELSKSDFEVVSLEAAHLNLGFPSPLAGKPVALLGVAAGRIGAIKSIEQLRGVCGHVGALVVPGSVSIASVQKAFDTDGRCTDTGTEAALRSLATSLLGFMRDYVCPKFIMEAAVRADDEAGAPWTTTV